MKTIKDFIKRNKEKVREFALYIASSLGATAFDWALYLLLLKTVGAGVQLSYSAGKIFSGVLNFTLNNFLVFKQGAGFGLIKRGMGYALTVFFSLILGNLLMAMFSALGFGAGLSKIITDVLCFFVNYFLQKNMVFNHR